MDDASVQNPEEMVRTFLVIFLTFKKKCQVEYLLSCILVQYSKQYAVWRTPRHIPLA